MQHPRYLGKGTWEYKNIMSEVGTVQTSFPSQKPSWKPSNE